MDKNGMIIDATSGGDPLVVDTTNVGEITEVGKRFDISTGSDIDISSGSLVQGEAKKVIPVTNTTGKRRKVVDISAISEPEEPDPNVKSSIEEDLLDFNNPDSLISKYIDRKSAEMGEWIKEKEEEKELNDLEKEDEAAVVDFDTDYRAPHTDADLSTLDDLFADEEDEDIVEDEEYEEEEEDEDIMPPREFKDNDTLEIEDVFEYDELEDDEDTVEDEEVVDDIWADDYDDEEEEDIVEEDDTSLEYAIEEDVSVQESAYEPEDDEEDDSEDEESETVPDSEVDANEALKKMRDLATARFKKTSKNLDISSLTVVKKATNNVSSITNHVKAKVAKWVLPAQSATVIMKEFSGSELERLREYSEDNRSLDSLNRRFKMIYDHIVSNKPDSYEKWVKSTPFADVDHYYFAVYMACFKNANYLPDDCPHCNEAFITDDIPMMDMVKFGDDKVKSKITKLYKSETDINGKGAFVSEIVPITDQIAIAFKLPSIYNMIETSTLDQNTSRRFSTIIDYVPYIDHIYIIDQQSQSLIPVGYKTYEGNPLKTTRSKLQKYDQLLSTIDVDKFNIIRAYIRTVNEMNNATDVTYTYPAVTCPNCKKETEEHAATAEELVFTRYQLAALTTMSLN